MYGLPSNNHAQYGSIANNNHGFDYNGYTGGYNSEQRNNGYQAGSFQRSYHYNSDTRNQEAANREAYTYNRGNSDDHAFGSGSSVGYVPYNKLIKKDSSSSAYVPNNIVTKEGGSLSSAYVPYNKVTKVGGSLSGAYVPYNKFIGHGGNINTPRINGRK
jgi:hypothetical protein